MNKEELIKYIFNEENYSNFISSQNGGEQYYILLEKEESKILKDYISNLQKKADKQKEVLDKIKEKVKELDRFDLCGSMAVSMSISQFQEDLERLLEEIE